MDNDSSVKWALANPLGILKNEEADGWNTGHINDVLVMANGSLLAASQTGGVWLVNENNTTLPLSDSWANPDINCLCQGPDDENHVFAGCQGGIICETDLGEALPLLAWKAIVNPLPDGAGDVNWLLIIRGLRYIIAACTGGIYWAIIPPTNPKRGCLFPFGTKPKPRPPFTWQRARMDDGDDAQGYWDAAVASSASNVNRSTLEDFNMITIVAGGYLGGGLFAGQFNAAKILVMHPSKVHSGNGSDTAALFTQMGSCSVASCESSANVTYAASSTNTKDSNLFKIFRSDDGGQSWTICKAAMAGEDEVLSNRAGKHGRSWNNCIAASPTFVNIVALGWNFPFLSIDSGQTWRRVQDDDHLHADIHAFRFAPEGTNWARNMYIASDGGVARIDLDIWLSGKPGFAQSNYNRFLAVLQCYSTVVRQFWGTSAVSDLHPGLIATGAQDNSNLSCVSSDTVPTPWTNIEGGDGGFTAFVNGDVLLHNIKGEVITATKYDSTGNMLASADITINQPMNNHTELKGPVTERVKSPSFRNELGGLLVALAAPNSSNQVFALFTDDEANLAYHWGFIGTVAAGVTITALASFDGSTIHAAASGRMFEMDTKTGRSKELPIEIPRKDPGSAFTQGGTPRIVYFNATQAFAIVNGVQETLSIFAPPVLKTVITSNYILRLAGSKWLTTKGTGLPNEIMYGLEAVQLPNSRFGRALFVTTDRAVYISREDSDTWGPASQNLPVMPHCADLRFAAFNTTSDAYLYLGTFGRSMWRAKLR